MRRYGLHWSDGTIVIDGAIRPDVVSAAALRRSLDELRDEPSLRVLIQSDGGSCDEGFAIYNLLRNTRKPIDVTIRRAASMAGVIAMAGTRVRIVDGGTFGLHHAARTPDSVHGALNASGRITAADFLAMSRELSRIDDVHLDIFQHRTGLTRSTVAKLRADETVLDAHEAVRLGFADEVISP